MRIDRNLNLVIPLEREDGPIYIHSTPISREVFERYYLVIAKTFASIHQEGLTVIAGPRVSYLMLRDIAQKSGSWDGPGGVQAGLINEMRRLTNVVMPGERGWHVVPFQNAIDREMLDDEEVAEAEGAIVFFTCVVAMHRKAVAMAMVDGLNDLWGTRTTSSNSTEFAGSLPTSTATETSAEAGVALVPSTGRSNGTGRAASSLPS